MTANQMKGFVVAYAGQYDRHMRVVGVYRAQITQTRLDNNGTITLCDGTKISDVDPTHDRSTDPGAFN